MDKPVAAIEVTNKAIKLVVGYELEGKIDVLYALVKNLGDVRANDEFIDLTSTASSLEALKQINDDNVRLRINITEALVALPPKGLLVYTTTQYTNIVSENSKVGSVDIHNVYSLIQKSHLPMNVNNDLVDIISDKFLLDHQRTFINPPIGETTNGLYLSAYVHTIPHRTYSDFKELFEKANIKVKRFVVSPFATAELLSTYPNTPKDYILVDIGARQTSVSLVGNGVFHSSNVFDGGGDNITRKIQIEFNIPEAEAESLKVAYGLTNRQLNFKPPVVAYQDEAGHEVRHYADELNNIIRTEVDGFAAKLNSAISNLLKAANITGNVELPLLLVGGGSLLKGLSEYLLPKIIAAKTIEVAIPTSLGCRNPAFFNCLGMIHVQSRYPSLNDERNPKLSGVERNRE